MTASADDASGHISILDFVVLLAMAVTAVAFAAGLIVNTGVDPMAGGIAAAALFLVMASSHFAITRASRPTVVSGRLDEIEEALIVLDGDLQRIDQVEDDVARLDLLTDKVERLDKAVSGGASVAIGAGAAEGGEQVERLSNDLERLTQQLEILRTEFESETRSQRDQIGAELRSLEIAIKDLSREMIASPAFAEIATLEVPDQASEIPLHLTEEAAVRDTEEAAVRDPSDDAPVDSSPNETDDNAYEADDSVALLVEETTIEFVPEDGRELNLVEADELNVTEDGELDLGEVGELNLADVETLLMGSSASLSERLAQVTAAEESEQAAEIPLGLAEPETEARDPGDDAPIDSSADETDDNPDEGNEVAALLLEETTLELSAETVPERDLAEIGEIDLTETGELDLSEIGEINLAKVETLLTGSSGSLSERLAQALAVEDDGPAVKQAIEAGRIDIYVAPVVSLPGRRLCYFDATARLRDETDDVLPAGESLAAAARERLLPRIDNVMLVKSVQLLRRLGSEATLNGVFCPLSLQSLSDADFFPELVEFLEENSTLGDSLIFQLDQSAIGDLGGDELGGLKTIGRLGFAFALDGVTSLDADYAALRDYFFRFVKIDAGLLLAGGAGAPAAPQDMTTHLDRFDLKLVACGVESEHGLSRLMEIGVDLAEGGLFASARPADATLFRELEETGAA